MLSNPQKPSPKSTEYTTKFFIDVNFSLIKVTNSPLKLYYTNKKVSLRTTRITEWMNIHYLVLFLNFYEATAK